MGRMNLPHFYETSSPTDDDRLELVTDGLIATLTGALIGLTRRDSP